MATPLPTSPSSDAQDQLTGSRALLNTGTANIPQQIALAPITGGLSLIPQATGLDWGSGKDIGQKRRDLVRSELQTAGFLDPNFLAKMANGNTFDFGADKLPNGQRVTNIDTTDPIKALAVGMANPIADALFKGNPDGQQTQWAAMMANAASQGATTPEEMRQNMMAMAQKMGYTQQGLQSALTSLNTANADPNNAAYQVGAASIFDPNTLSAIKPVLSQPTAHGEPPGPTTAPIDGATPQQTPINQSNITSNISNGSITSSAPQIQTRAVDLPASTQPSSSSAAPSDSSSADSIGQGLLGLIGKALKKNAVTPLPDSPSVDGIQPNQANNSNGQQGIVNSAQLNKQNQPTPLYKNNTLGGMPQGLPQNNIQQQAPASGMMGLNMQGPNPVANAVSGQTGGPAPDMQGMQFQDGQTPQQTQLGLLSLVGGF